MCVIVGESSCIQFSWPGYHGCQQFSEFAKILAEGKTTRVVAYVYWRWMCATTLAFGYDVFVAQLFLLGNICMSFRANLVSYACGF